MIMIKSLSSRHNRCVQISFVFWHCAIEWYESIQPYHSEMSNVFYVEANYDELNSVQEQGSTENVDVQYDRYSALSHYICNIWPVFAGIVYPKRERQREREVGF